jgi:hypothetical protein
VDGRSDHDDPASRGGAVTRWPALVLVAAAVAVLGGCDLATGRMRTTIELQDAGIRNPNLQYDRGEATLEYDSRADRPGVQAEQDRAAEVIWKNLPFRIDRITVFLRDGFTGGRRTYPRPLLERQFGPRPAGLDRSPSELARRAILIAAVVALVVLLAVVLIIVLVVRAVRRRPSPQPAAWPQGQGQPWGQPGQGQPAWGQPGYGDGQPPDEGWPQPPGPPSQGDQGRQGPPPPS